LPNCNTNGRMAAAEAPPYSRTDVSDGSTRYEVNSGGNEVADSFKVLGIFRIRRY
jgi:hypothetical protein